MPSWSVTKNGSSAITPRDFSSGSSIARGRRRQRHSLRIWVFAKDLSTRTPRPRHPRQTCCRTSSDVVTTCNSAELAPSDHWRSWPATTQLCSIFDSSSLLPKRAVCNSHRRLQTRRMGEPGFQHIISRLRARRACGRGLFVIHALSASPHSPRATLGQSAPSRR